MGVDLLTLKTRLGHSQIQTSFAYVSTSDLWLFTPTPYVKKKQEKVVLPYKEMNTKRDV